ncbi:hypothetical protein [Methanolacinia paynteri]|uniref:hypothetical protein n=1 Tax=Methanolacinia paynteri TaxID=230356 RepID=UPI00064F1BD6|nr:hypothetical protein [Methanolacinia paynteri]
MGAEEEAAFFLTEIHEKFRNNVNEIKDITKTLQELKKDLRNLKFLDEKEIKSGISGVGSSLDFLSKRLDDVADFFEFYLGNESSVNVVLLERDAYMKINQILRWNKVDVRELKRWVEELDEIAGNLKRNPHDLLNFRKLPTIDIPDAAIKYPVWAIDKSGYCLAGSDYSEIIHIDEVLEEMESGNVPFPVHSVSTR